MTATIHLPTSINNRADAEQFFAEMVRVCGLGFHPDTRADDYTERSGERVFSDADADRIERLIGQAVAVGIDLHALGLEIFRRNDLLVDEVKQAMQKADEIGGPTGIEYLNVMTEIEREARQRHDRYLGTLDHLAMSGVWTPWAEVLCFRCHGPRFRDKVQNPVDFDAECRIRTTEEKFNEGRTRCGRCHAPIWVRQDVADLHNLLLAVSADDALNLGAEMQQTGGLCAALVMRAQDGAYVATGMGEATLDIGFYPGASWDTEDGFDPDGIDVKPFETVEAALAHLKTEEAKRAGQLDERLRTVAQKVYGELVTGGRLQELVTAKGATDWVAVEENASYFLSNEHIFSEANYHKVFEMVATILRDQHGVTTWPKWFVERGQSAAAAQ